MASYSFRYFLMILALATAPTASSAVQARPKPLAADRALLRCDPWTVIKNIDGQVRRINAMQAGAFTDCELRLSPGPHVLKVCYETRRLERTATVNVTHVYRCDNDQQIDFHASPGHIYRIKLRVEGKFAAWIEDVTAAEANLAPSPSVNKSRRVAKADRQSTILVRVLGSEVPSFLTGTALNFWFKASRMQQFLHGDHGMQQKSAGFFTGTVSNGDSLAIRRVQMGDQHAFVCDTNVPVYEDLPGGRVLYLGDYRFEPGPGGTRFTLTHDLEAARRFLVDHHPDLAAKLESAVFRPLRVPEPCLLLPAANRLRLGQAE